MTRVPDHRRLRDAVMTHTGEDIDRLVHPLLIRAAAAYLDQGVAYWSMPGGRRSFLEAFRELYARPGSPSATSCVATACRAATPAKSTRSARAL